MDVLQAPVHFRGVIWYVIYYVAAPCCAVRSWVYNLYWMLWSVRLRNCLFVHVPTRVIRAIAYLRERIEAVWSGCWLVGWVAAVATATRRNTRADAHLRNRRSRLTDCGQCSRSSTSCCETKARTHGIGVTTTTTGRTPSRCRVRSDRMLWRRGFVSGRLWRLRRRCAVCAHRWRQRCWWSVGLCLCTCANDLQSGAFKVVH